MSNQTNPTTSFERNDEVTRAFLDLREGKATSKQELIIFNVCRRKVNILASNYLTAIDKDEFLGDLFLRVLDKKESYDPKKSSFETWLSWQCLAVRKNLYDGYSRAVKKTAYSLDELSDAFYKGISREIEDPRNVSPDKRLIFDECMEVVDEIIEELSINQRNAIEAVYNKNMKPGEAAEMLGRKKADFYRDHNRALGSLKEKLENRGYSLNDVREILTPHL